MTNQFPITPPPKLVGDWLTEAADLHLLTPTNLDYLATRAAQWGADQELEACYKQLIKDGWFTAEGELRAARRPKPPSLKEQALAVLTQYMTGETILTKDSVDTIRRAIEALPNE